MNIIDEDFIKQYVTDKYSYKKLISYLERHEIIGEEIFPYLGEGHKELIIHFGDRNSYCALPKEVFIKRIPFYFYKPKENSRDIGELSQYTMGIIREPSIFKDSEECLERLYISLEKLFYYYKLDLNTIFQYTIDQTGYVCQTQVFFDWFHYLELAEQLNLAEKTPECLIIDYNNALEKVGLEPVIFELGETFISEYIYRRGNVFELSGTFPCDTEGRPIIRWVGVKIKNATKIWAKVDKKQKGYLYVEVSPKTAIWGRNCWGKDSEGNDVWYPLYLGPQLMHFDSSALKYERSNAELSQKQVAEMIGISVRTYQKWESGETTPDSQNLLRLMNVLDITDTKYLTKWIDVENGESVLSSEK
ncbi:helix-turn-helix transcriptional regulator [Paenibacillus sp. 19GGS1-52]|uniref:helix-turn-helix domain-containing protein n=1 Tax=Paenibacillus sp. 19GGS1-52 TaxID=2758563 RepID=UPI001EFBE4CE|nr:helix-turn-helix transcriptional regulator [Paenibacillus sp. 19GGS1-52]ULO06260.1 helix-turn-helix transcriptional regulator [Paenibacillus sp. 19GGS1-52]